MAVPLKKPAKTTSLPAAPAVSSAAPMPVKVEAPKPPAAKPVAVAPKPPAAKPVAVAPKPVAPEPKKAAAKLAAKPTAAKPMAGSSMPLNRQIPRKPARMPTQDIPLEVNWRMMQEISRLTFYRTSSGDVKLWAPEVPVAELKAHWKQYTPLQPDAVFTHRDEYWCPHCAEVKLFKWLACTDDLRCPGCGVPNYDEAVVKANHGEGTN